MLAGRSSLAARRLKAGTTSRAIALCWLAPTRQGQGRPPHSLKIEASKAVPSNALAPALLGFFLISLALGRRGRSHGRRRAPLQHCPQQRLEPAQLLDPGRRFDAEALLQDR